MKVLEIKDYMQFSLDFDNTILSCLLFFFFLFFYWLILSNILQLLHIFDPNAEFLIPIGIPTKEVKSEIETHPLILEAKTRKCSI